MTARRVRRAHAWVTIRIIPWAVCRYCGLICLRNDATRRAARAVCETWEDEP